MRIVTIVQARMGSTRLPGKVLLPLGDGPMLGHVLARAARMQEAAEVIVATSQLAADDAIADFCAAQGVRCFRGDEQDVLARYLGAAHFSAAEGVVRITADCPFIDPGVCDRVIAEFRAGQPGLDYACNFHPARTFPRGLDVEVMRRDVLERCGHEARDPASREHVTAFIYAHPERFALHGVTSETDHSALRWTVDTPADLDLARRIYTHFGRNDFTWHEVLEALAIHPEWTAINAHIQQKSVA
jgi:spore coat polysaccharide biosynthesis protein SpsF